MDIDLAGSRSETATCDGRRWQRRPRNNGAISTPAASGIKLEITMPTCRMWIPACLVLAFVGKLGAADPQVSPQQAEFFEKRVRPVLVENCFSCHGEKKQEAGLR